MHVGGDANIVGLDLVGVGPPQGDLALAALDGLVQGDHDVGLDVVAARGHAEPPGFLSVESAEGTAAAPATAAEERLEEVTETGAAEFELDAARTPSGARLGEIL